MVRAYIEKIAVYDDHYEFTFKSGVSVNIKKKKNNVTLTFFNHLIDDCWMMSGFFLIYNDNRKTCRKAMQQARKEISRG